MISELYQLFRLVRFSLSELSQRLEMS